jgi:uncharacterized membrane protein
MSMLLVLAFDNEVGAQEMIGHVQIWQRQQLITVSDAATVVRQADGKVKIKQANSLVGAGTFGGAFWGLFVGFFFLMPWHGMAITNIHASKASNYGLDDDFITEVGNVIKPGCSALFMIVAFMAEEKVLAEFAEYNVTVLRTTLSPEDEIKLCEAFGVVDEF